MDEADVVRRSYDLSPKREWKRLEGFHFEFEITKRFLSKYMQGKSVLDIGGGPGRYSVYLAKLGYDVTLVDLSPANVEFAKKKAAQENVNIAAYAADARDLSRLGLGEYDNVLLMGPLYHLFKRSDRARCVAEAKRHLKKDGALFASFISITAGYNFYLDTAPRKLINESALHLFEKMERDETWTGRAFTDAAFVNLKEIEPFFDECGFEKLTVFGQEGLCGPRLTYIERSPKKVRDLYMDISLRLCENPQYFPYSNHIMYIGKAK